MTKNPIYNAILATGYITLVASVMFYGPKFENNVDSVIAPITILSLFVLSAAMMGFLFFYQPIQMYLDGGKKEALNLFLKTLAIFGCITAVFLGILFLGVIR